MEKGLTPREPGAVSAREPEALSISPAYVQQTVKSIALLQDMVRSLLIRGRDYGRTPGTASDGLWDPGANLITAGFNCYFGQRRVLRIVDDDERMSVIVEVPVISRSSGNEVGSGIGAASTLEVKYKYRWLYPLELKELGYTDEQIRSLKTDNKVKAHQGKRRIENPERGELLNTLIKQASKRGEVDAAEALPGVASTLRELFNPEDNKEQGPRWQRYWGEVSRLGVSESESYEKLGVTSMQDWLAKGRSLDDALDILRGKQPTKTEETPKDSAGPTVEGEGFHIDVDFLKKALKARHWSEDTCKSYLAKYKVSIEGTLTEVLSRLSRQQAEEFTKELSNPPRA